MLQYPPIFVLRHGQTTWNREGRFQGHLDAPLTDLGRAQAAQQGRILRDKVLPRHGGLVLRVSPLGRTCTTWDIAAETAGAACPMQLDPRLIEVNMGAWQGRLRAEILAEDVQARVFPNVFELSLNTPGGETFDALTTRLKACLQEITQPTVCVTHGITSLVLRGLVRGLSRDAMAGQGHDQGVVYALIDGQEHRLEA